MKSICLDASNMTLGQAVALERLWTSIWPPEDEPLTEEFIQRTARETLDKMREPAPSPEQRRRVFAIFDDGEPVAASLVEAREVVTCRGPVTVAALAGVATRPDRRGRGLGRAVVEAVFDLVDRGDFGCSLFQTSNEVLPFYEKLGARQVHNRFHDSTADDPDADPFWDDVRVVYPATYDWPDGPVDTRGPGW
jgi:GNAT superfamily N-acetyltransferase